MAVKALHIEPVSDLTSDAFLVAYNRFVTRKGAGSVIQSDNATNFKGAVAEIESLSKATSTMFREIGSAIAIQGTTWEFIPLRAPHFGDLCGLIRSFKHHLRRVIGDTHLTLEEMSTLTA